MAAALPRSETNGAVGTVAAGGGPALGRRFAGGLRRSGVTLLNLALVSIALASFAVGAALAASPAGEANPGPSEAEWGVKAVSLRPTMDGRMLDFRYEVVDAARARPLFDRKLKPYLIDQRTGSALGMPDDTKLGALRASVRNPPVAGKRYYIIFANTFGKVKAGDRVTVLIGDCRFRNLIVE